MKEGKYERESKDNVWIMLLSFTSPVPVGYIVHKIGIHTNKLAASE